MKICPNCNQQVEDNAAFCAHCGMQFSANANQGNPGYANYAPAYDPYDHTAEFDAKDISENKVISMLVYLMGAIGIIIALLASNTSRYAAFHVRQALKFTVVEILSVVLCIIPIIGVFAWAILAIVLLVVKIICFFQICSGKAKEPAIIRSLGFLR